MAARAKSIVVGYDGSEAARRALDRAADLVDGYGSTLAVVTVTGRDEDDATTATLDDARERLLARHVTASYVEQVGEPADRLVEAATSRGADLLVVGRRDHGALERLVLGSVSTKVLHGAPCDVLVVR
ncbi:MAG: universal stress protein [Gaiellaceae bacterium]|jgi:nucleotide-binding universal stress UspA family protein|nr:universal stress protein [Gaiellaceae bacterium]